MEIDPIVICFSLDPGCNRYSLGFTLRDSPTDFVNVTCWGNDTFINDIAKSFKINDVGKIGCLRKFLPLSLQKIYFDVFQCCS
jgi:hypothetical protein